MRSRAVALILAALAGACGYGTTPPYASSGPITPFNEDDPYGPYNAPTLWISYPTEGDENICLSGDGRMAFPVYFVVYNPPADARVRFRLDRHLDGGTVLSPLADPAVPDPFWVSLAGHPAAVGRHLIDGEVVNADGSPIETNNVTHQFQVSFTSRARSAEDERCPLPPEADGGT